MPVTVYKYQDTIADPATGRPAGGVTVAVKLHSGGAPATLYNEAGTVVQTAPVLSDASGLFFFWAEDGTYDIECSMSGVSASRTGIYLGSVGTWEQSLEDRAYALEGRATDLESAVTDLEADVPAAIATAAADADRKSVV